MNRSTGLALTCTLLGGIAGFFGGVGYQTNNKQPHQTQEQTELPGTNYRVLEVGTEIIPNKLEDSFENLEYVSPSSTDQLNSFPTWEPLSIYGYGCESCK